jgi:hypothetical protein
VKKGIKVNVLFKDYFEKIASVRKNPRNGPVKNRQTQYSSVAGDFL